MPSNQWRDVLLEQVAEEITVGYVGPMASEYVPIGIPFLRSQNVEQLVINQKDIKYITPEFHKQIKKSALSPGDVVIVRTGKPGASAVIPSWLPVSNCSDLVIVRCGPNLDSRFLAYYINSSASDHVSAHLVGAVQQHFNVASARKIRMLLPDINEQRAIVRILGTLDDKMEVNRRMNVTLESMTRAIFRQWFVENKEVGAWEVGRLGDLCQSTIGGDWGEDIEFKDSIPVICLRGTDLDNLRNSGYSEDAPVRWIKKSSLEKRQLSDGDILIAGSGIGPVGKPLWVSPEMLKVYSYPVIYSNFVKRFQAKSPEYAVYIDRVLFNMRESDEIWDYINGTSIPNLNDKDLLAYHQITIPPEKLVKDFYDYVRPIYAKLYNKESRTLARLRDSLLPKLMRGEVRVKDMESRL